MSGGPEFTGTQKQYLSGFVLGAEIARSVSTLNQQSRRAVAEVEPPKALQVDQPAEHLTAEEKAKRDKNGLDLWDEIAERSRKGEFPKGTDVFLQKFQGLFYVAPAQKSYMCRLRLPGGVLSGYQLNGLADLCEQFAGGYADVTTRANLQLREIPAEHGIDVLYGLRALGIINLGAGADNIRNVTCSALSGIDPDELIETLPLAQQMHHYILNHRTMYGLPRKFNIAFEGCGQIASLEDTNDIGFTAVRVEQGNDTVGLTNGTYFLLSLGGITGHRDFARSTDVLVTPDETVSLAAAVVQVFLQYGDRSDRTKSRLKYLLDSMGMTKFLEHVEAVWKRPLKYVERNSYRSISHEGRQKHVGVHTQRQAGLYYIGIVLPVGRMTAEQMRGLARLANQYGRGELRLTVWQNLLIPYIEAQHLDIVSNELLALGLDYRASSFRAGLVACTGNAGCKYAAANTKRHALELSDFLEQNLQFDTPVNIHLTGCHHSCAQHYIGDIGLLACRVERNEEVVEGYHLHVGGGWGERQGIGRLVRPSLTFEETKTAVHNLLASYLRRRGEQESFVSFCRAHTENELLAMTSQDARNQQLSL